MISDEPAPSRKNLPPQVQVLCRQRKIKIHHGSVADLCTNLLRALGQSECALSVVFVGLNEMRLMNRRYLNKDYPTDVLSFPYDRILVEDRPFLGEIVIAPETAVEQAARYRTSAEKEIRKLVLHGILHLMGYDHDKDRGQMNALQRRLMGRKFFIGSPLIISLKAKQ